MEAEPVVAAGIEAVSRGQPVVVPGAPNKVLAALTRIVPESLGRAIVRSQTSRLRRKT
jgi:short-subunit dehydrogenase